MSQAEANKALLTDIYRQWHETRGGCVAELLCHFADDVNFGSLAEGAAPVAFTTRRIGKQELQGYFDGLTSAWAMDYYKIDDMIAEGDRVAVVCSTCWTNKATGKPAETPKVDVWQFQDGKAIAFYEYYDTAKLLGAAA